MNKEFTPNKLIECPEPGILFTRSNAAWAYHALKAVRESGQSIPEQDELCDELAGILFPPAPGSSRPGIPWQPEELAGHAPYCVHPSHSLGVYCSAGPSEPGTLHGQGLSHHRER